MRVRLKKTEGVFIRQLREFDGHWSDLATRYREVGGILVDAFVENPAAAISSSRILHRVPSSRGVRFAFHVYGS